MKCPKCKNPIQKNTIECEWCGAKILIEDIQQTSPKNLVLIPTKN